MRLVLSAVVLLSALSCSHPPAVQSDWTPAAPPPDNVEPAAVATDVATVAQMHALLEATSTLREQASRGQSDAVRAAATEFVASLQPEPSTPGVWLDPLASIRTQAEALASHETDAQAAVALAHIARACGDCHVSTGVQQSVAKTLERGPAPPLGSTEADAMGVHDWATQRMWDSLIVPDKDRWVEGTTLFVLLPSCVDQDLADVEHGLRCDRARAIARRAHVVSELDGRTSLMGDLLGTCASCHRAASAPQG